MPPPPTFDLRLASSRMLAPNVRELTFARTDCAPFEFEAGQWVSLVLPLPDGEGRRAYSIASAPNGTQSLAIAVTKVEGGPGSTYLHELQSGRDAARDRSTRLLHPRQQAFRRCSSAPARA